MIKEKNDIFQDKKKVLVVRTSFNKIMDDIYEPIKQDLDNNKEVIPCILTNTPLTNEEKQRFVKEFGKDWEQKIHIIDFETYMQIGLQSLNEQKISQKNIDILILSIEYCIAECKHGRAAFASNIAKLLMLTFGNLLFENAYNFLIACDSKLYIHNLTINNNFVESINNGIIISSSAIVQASKAFLGSYFKSLSFFMNIWMYDITDVFVNGFLQFSCEDSILNQLFNGSLDLEFGKQLINNFVKQREMFASLLNNVNCPLLIQQFFSHSYGNTNMELSFCIQKFVDRHYGASIPRGDDFAELSYTFNEANRTWFYSQMSNEPLTQEESKFSKILTEKIERQVKSMLLLSKLVSKDRSTYNPFVIKSVIKYSDDVTFKDRINYDLLITKSTQKHSDNCFYSVDELLDSLWMDPGVLGYPILQITYVNQKMHNVQIENLSKQEITNWIQENMDGLFTRIIKPQYIEFMNKINEIIQQMKQNNFQDNNDQNNKSLLNSSLKIKQNEEQKISFNLQNIQLDEKIQSDNNKESKSQQQQQQQQQKK